MLSIILRRYREPHLQKSEVLSEIPKGKVNAASKYITQLGYYNLVNMFRLQHAALYKEAHPAAKQEEIAEEGAQKRGGNRRQNREVCETLNPLYRHDFRTFSRTLATEVAR